MGERKRKGGLTQGVDPAVAAWQKGAAENKAALTGKQKRDRKRTRVHIDVDVALKAALETLAGCEDTSISQAAEMLLAYGLRAYGRNSAEVASAFRDGREPARTPKFGWNVEIPNGWLTEIEHFHCNGKADGKVGGKVDGKV